MSWLDDEDLVASYNVRGSGEEWHVIRSDGRMVAKYSTRSAAEHKAALLTKIVKHTKYEIFGPDLDNEAAPTRERRTVCIETGEVFKTATEAAKAVGVSSGQICNSCKTGGLAGGLHWMRLGHPPKTLLQDRRKKVLCVDTGEVFESAAKAAASIGVRRCQVWKCCHKRGTCMGMKFEFVGA